MSTATRSDGTLTEEELAEYDVQCDCGRYPYNQVIDIIPPQEHRESIDHAEGLMAGYDDYDWNRLVEHIDNGLGWATNEGMSDCDDGEVMAQVRALVAHWRAAR